MPAKKIYEGAVVIFYQIKNGQPLFLVVQNTKTGNTAFVAGAKEDYDNSLLATAQREIKEELGFDKNQYQLISTEIKYEFIFGPQKKERAGATGHYQVFLGKFYNPLEISYTPELKTVKWLTSDQTLEVLTFQDLKEVFGKVRNLMP
ncbi:MAG: NUDIX domain-containing protein [Patescibacteria group bacterium]